MRSLTAATGAVAIPLAYSLCEPWRLVVRRYDVHLPGLPDEFDGLRIAQLSDLHCSAITPAALVRKAVLLCNAEAPNVVVLTGDYISRRNSYLLASGARLWAAPIEIYETAVVRELALLLAPEGCFAVPGNHDYAEGRMQCLPAWFEEIGIQMLRNKSVLLRGQLPLLGLDDLRAGRPLCRATLAQTERGRPHLILSHNPRLILDMASRNCLMLSGHIHGGQVHLPFTRFRRKPRDVRGTAWLSGWYHYGEALLYISVGAGSVHFPMRFRCPPEIAIFTLRARPSDTAVKPN